MAEGQTLNRSMGAGTGKGIHEVKLNVVEAGGIQAGKQSENVSIGNMEGEDIESHDLRNSIKEGKREGCPLVTWH